MKYLILLFAIALSHCVPAQSGDLQRYYLQAMQAFKAGQAGEFYTLISKAREIHPYHQGILYQSGIAAAMTNRNDEAIEYLKRALLIQSDFHLNVPELKVLESDPRFKQLKQIKAEANRAIINSDTAFILQDRQLHLESIAQGEADGVFYGGSIRKRKIVRISKNKVEDFTSEGQDGLCSVFGVKADPRRKVLWVSSSPMPEMQDYDSTLTSAVHAYDINIGKLIRKVLPGNPRMALVLGDLVISERGEVYVSDSRSNMIFRVSQSGTVLEQFFSSDDFWNIQGIALSGDGRYLFVADYVRGLFRLELEGRRLIHLEASFDISLKGIDGLVWYDNTLIAIQNNVNPMRVTRYTLNRGQDALVSFEILDKKHPAFNEPTLGCIQKDEFYYVANSQWGGYDENHQIKPSGQLQDIVILMLKLQ